MVPEFCVRIYAVHFKLKICSDQSIGIYRRKWSSERPIYKPVGAVIRVPTLTFMTISI